MSRRRRKNSFEMLNLSLCTRIMRERGREINRKNSRERGEQSIQGDTRVVKMVNRRFYNELLMAMLCNIIGLDKIDISYSPPWKYVLGDIDNL